MIRIARTAEPARLEPVRRERLDAARVAFAQGARIEFKDYDLVKAELAAMQFNKCCYCEKPEEQPKYRDVEHYRPKSTYWWLAWTWDNLLFSCIDCNREHKRDLFPLSNGDHPLAPEDAPPGTEHPLVIDPTDPGDDPTVHIEFRRDKVQGQERWMPYGVTPRGRRTIEVCGLDRPGLLTFYKAHVDDAVRPRLAELSRAVEGSDPQAVVRAWSTLTRRLLHPARPFRALSHDAIAALVPSSTKARYSLVLARPGP